jgi:hypothetical protein
VVDGRSSTSVQVVQSCEQAVRLAWGDLRRVGKGGNSQRSNGQMRFVICRTFVILVVIQSTKDLQIADHLRAVVAVKKSRLSG